MAVLPDKSLQGTLMSLLVALVGALLAAGTFAADPVSVAGSSFSVVQVGEMSVERATHQATPLRDGKILNR